MAKKDLKKEVKTEISLKDMTMSELSDKAKSIAVDIQKKKLDKAVGKTKNIKEVFFLRKTLARVKTELNTKMRLNSVKS